MNLRREASEAHSNIECVKNLIALIKEPLTKAEGNIPVVDIEQVQVGEPAATSQLSVSFAC